LRHGDATGVLELECRPSTVGGSVGVGVTPDFGVTLNKCLSRLNLYTADRAPSQMSRYPQTAAAVLSVQSPSCSVRRRLTYASSASAKTMF
ncbi:hypothetical protein T12_9687, partial [Trichinella patagoniensis]